MSRDPRLYIMDILEAIEAITEYTEGLTEAEFTDRRMVQDAVFRRIEIIGEAARQLPTEIKDRAPEIPWVDIVGMRNRLTHEYFGVLPERAWSVIEFDLPILRVKIEEMKEEME